MFQFGKKSVIWKWIISYICIILVLAASNLMTYYRSQSIIQERQQKINEVVLEQASEQIHDCIVMMENLREEILTNKNYTALNHSTLSPYSSTTYKQYLLFTNLNTYHKLNSSYSRVMLYFADDDKIIADNSVNSSRDYWNIYHDSILSFSRERWNEIIGGTYDSVNAVHITGGSTGGTLFSRTIQAEQFGKQKVNLFVLISNGDWENLLGKYQSYNTSMLMLDREGNAVVFDSAFLSIGPEEEQLITEAISLGKKEAVLRGNEVVYLDYKASNSAISICILTPEKIYREIVNQFQILFSSIFVTTILFSIILIGMFVSRNYKPVRDLVKSLAPDDMLRNSQYSENEFALVSKSVKQVKDKYQHVNIALERQNKLLQRLYLSKLLFGETKALSEKELKDIYNIRFIFNQFAVVLFFVEDFTGEPNEKPTDETEIIDLDHAQFILVRVYSEIIRKAGWIANHTKVDDILALIINFPSGEDNMLQPLLNNCRKEIAASYNLEYATAVSNVHCRLQQLALAYQEALYALEAKKLYDLDNEVHYSEIAELSGSSYHYPYNLEQDLMRCIQLDQFNSAKAVFEKVIQENINKMVPHDMIRCLLFDLLGTVMKAFDGKKESQAFIKQLKPAKRLSECRDLQEMQKAFTDILKKSCVYFKAGSDNGQYKHLCVQLKKYIQENYQDTNLSVTSIANHFSMSPVEMSRIFRDITGTRISTVLSEIRVQAAKGLILSSNESFSGIADKVGFGSTKTFTRVFKQLEGCTPGQWRDAQRSVG